jgi:hypothetical protein
MFLSRLTAAESNLSLRNTGISPVQLWQLFGFSLSDTPLFEFSDNITGISPFEKLLISLNPRYVSVNIKRILLFFTFCLHFQLFLPSVK